MPSYLFHFYPLNFLFHHVDIDYIIVGQGLAGSAVAVHAMLKGKRILVIDQYANNTSSKVAAGLFNPVTGKVMGKTWMADTLFPFLHTFYHQVESATGARFFHKLPIYRPFKRADEQNEWMGNAADPGWRLYIKEVMLHSQPQWGARDSLGGLLLSNCGYVDTETYVDAVAKWISRHNILRREQFRYDKVSIHAGGVTYEGYRARAIIFCEGIGARANPWFSWLPIRPLTGEVLLIQPDHPFEVILNRGVYVVPAAGGQFCVGSTYSHGIAEGVTPEGRRELESKLTELITVNYRVSGQRWGVRPTTPDRKPLVGRHPDHACMWVFNGLGTKGISLAPYFSNYLVNCLENEDLINNAVDISRYK